MARQIDPDDFIKSLTPEQLANLAAKADGGRFEQAQSNALYRTADTLFRQLSPNTARAVAISLSLSCRYAIEGKAAKELWLKDCAASWDQQQAFLEQALAQQAEARKKLEGLMAKNGEKPVGEAQVLQFPVQASAPVEPENLSQALVSGSPASNEAPKEEPSPAGEA